MWELDNGSNAVETTAAEADVPGAERDRNDVTSSLV